MPKITGYKPCLNCGQPAAVRQNRWERTKFCSVSCGAKHRSELAGIKAAADARKRRQTIEQPLSYRLIALTKGGIAKVDIEDYDFAKQSNWCLSDKGYARRTIKINGQKKNERLHRLIAERVAGHKIPFSTQVDHENGDRLDCRRKNVRPATHNQNSWNIRRKNKLGFAGVAKCRGRYQAKIMAFRTSFYIGTFDTPEVAAWFRDQWAIALHGDFARLNFDYQEVA